MQTCSNCRFRSNDPARRLNLGEGPEHDFPTSYYYCERVAYDDHPLGISHAPGLGAVVNGGGGAGSGFYVELDFACNRWEPKTLLQMIAEVADKDTLVTTNYTYEPPT